MTSRAIRSRMDRFGYSMWRYELTAMTMTCTAFIDFSAAGTEIICSRTSDRNVTKRVNETRSESDKGGERSRARQVEQREAARPAMHQSHNGLCIALHKSRVVTDYRSVRATSLASSLQHSSTLHCPLVCTRGFPEHPDLTGPGIPYPTTTVPGSWTLARATSQLACTGTQPVLRPRVRQRFISLRREAQESPSPSAARRLLITVLTRCKMQPRRPTALILRLPSHLTSLVRRVAVLLHDQIKGKGTTSWGASRHVSSHPRSWSCGLLQLGLDRGVVWRVARGEHASSAE